MLYDVMYAGDPGNNVFIGNTISDCDYGIRLGWEAGITEIEYNTLDSNTIGIYLDETVGTSNITNNEITRNDYGVSFYLYATPQNIVNNTIAYNDVGIRFDEGTNQHNIFHNNFIKNTIQAFDNASNDNYWDNDYPSGGNFWSDYSGEDIYSGPNHDIPGSDGIGDTPYIFDFSQDNYPLMDPTGVHLYLNNGWSFVSIPNKQPDSDASKILRSIKDNYTALQYYDSSDAMDPWKHYHSDKPSDINDLHKIDHNMGFWIKVTEPEGLIFESPGIPPQTNQNIQLYKGWNMVGYPSYSKYNRTVGLNNLVYGSEVDSVWTYNARNQNWEEIGESDCFFKGYGYWIHATQDCVWEVPL